jgi:superfamily II DNA or RNA helicase
MGEQLLELSLQYERGIIIIKGDFKVPRSTYDPRYRSAVALALDYAYIVEYLKRSKIPYVDNVLDPIPCPHLECKVNLRPYQKKALDAWIITGGRGVVVLPTGAGKTAIGVAAIAHLNAPTIVVVPTLDLVEQWRRVLEKEFGVKIGTYGGGQYTMEALTVSTYDSAYIRCEELGNRFCFIIFDEVHHLPSAGYSHIAEVFASPSRLGLTATYEREDGLHSELPRLVGGKVFELRVQDLAGTHLSPFELEKIYVDLTSEEEAEYERLHKVFRDYLRLRGIPMSSPEDFTRFVMISNREPGARKALLARNRALEIALNSKSKIEALQKILTKSPDEPTIIFTAQNKLVHQISIEFLIPCITYLTSKEERTEILDNFREGRYRTLVTSRVLDEGVDVPDATRAIILSGTGSSREFIQRLGRILRKKEGKKAKLIEVVSKKTTEILMSKRRKRAWEKDQSSSA